MSMYAGKYDPMDFLGKKVYVGSLVVYPVRRRSSMWLTTARVSEVDIKVSGVYQSKRPKVDYVITAINDQGRRVKLLHPERLICVPDSDTDD